MLNYDPHHWYWLAEDGRLFSSKSLVTIPITDVDYLAWQAGGNAATVWPKDGAGRQTTEALQDVLTPYGLFADLKSYAADARYRYETGGVKVVDVTYLSDRETQAKLTSAVVMTQVNPSTMFEWKVADGSFVSLNAAGMVAVALAVGAHVQTAFATEATVAAAIDAGTITTKAQVDAAFA